jgi:hypothetical protein
LSETSPSNRYPALNNNDPNGSWIKSKENLTEGTVLSPFGEKVAVPFGPVELWELNPMKLAPI